MTTKKKQKRHSRPPTIALCVIARDEEEFLADCLDSARPYVDEVVVLDTGSTDRTREIAAEHGARVETFEWCDDFSAARNAAVDAATSDWILMLDADERLEVDSGPLLHELAMRATAETHVYMVQIENQYGESAHEISADYVPRLFPRGPHVRFFHRIHEQPLWAQNPDLTNMVESPIRVRHLGYTAEVMQARRKDDRNRRMLEEELRQNPDSLRAQYFLLRQSRATSRWEEVIALAERMLVREEQIKPLYLVDIYRMIFTALSQLERYEDVDRFVARGEARGVLSAESRETLAFCALKRGDHAGAVEHLTRALEPDAPRSVTWLPGSGGWRTRKQLAELCGHLGRAADAVEHFAAAYPEVPESERFDMALNAASLSAGIGAYLDTALWTRRAAEQAPDDVDRLVILVTLETQIPEDLVGDPAALSPLHRAVRGQDWQTAYDCAVNLPLGSARAVAQVVFVASRLAELEAFDASLDLLNRVIDVAPRSQQLYWQLVHVLTKLGRFEDAMASAEVLRGLGGDQPLAAAA